MGKQVGEYKKGVPSLKEVLKRGGISAPIWIDFGNGIGQFLDIDSAKFDSGAIDGGTYVVKLHKVYPFEWKDVKITSENDKESDC